MQTTYDVIIIGGGPAGCAASVYAARKKLSTLLLTETFGGQSIVSDDIENWIGEPHISGFELAQKLEAHVRAYPDEVIIKMPERVTGIDMVKCEEKRPCDFVVHTNQDNAYRGKTIILATGGRRRKLGIPGEEKFEGKGVVYCSTCDAPLFKDKRVAVVGGGNAGLEAVVDLLPYASQIYLLDRNERLKGDKVVQERIKQEDKVDIKLHTQPVRIEGDQFISQLVYTDNEEAEHVLDVEGVFVEIGSVPNSEFLAPVVKLDKWGQVKIDSKHATTSRDGIFAAGDVTDDPYKQNNISAGDGVKAALAAYAYLQQIHKKSPAADPKRVQEEKEEKSSRS